MYTESVTSERHSDLMTNLRLIIRRTKAQGLTDTLSAGRVPYGAPIPLLDRTGRHH